MGKRTMAVSIADCRISIAGWKKAGRMDPNRCGVTDGFTLRRTSEQMVYTSMYAQVRASFADTRSSP
jgi:hypothetical protein